MKTWVICSLALLSFATLDGAYASCADDWVACRQDARNSKKECLSGCDSGDRQCRSDCESTQKSEYQDCDAVKAECRGSESGRSGDSGSSGYRPPPPNRAEATFCATNYGSCPMVITVPMGSSCYCASPAGPIWGIAR